MPYTNELIGGGNHNDFAHVRHLRLEGDQQSIGRDLTEIAWTEHQVRPTPTADASITRARRRWRERNWPELELRAHGVAEHWQLPLDDSYELATLPIGFPTGGCSAAWLPREHTTTGAPLLSRNFDFPTLTFDELTGAPPHPGEHGFASTPYVIETRPTNGHATITVTAFDLLAAAVDGINDAGLVAALLSDDASTTGDGSTLGLEPTMQLAAGLSEVELCRYVLERCADTDEALEALRLARHYYFLHPQHFIVGDRSGRSFVYEYSPAHNKEYVIWGDGVQLVTNHLLHRYPTLTALPAADGPGRTFARFRTLQRLLSGGPPCSPDELIERLAHVRFVDKAAPVRTLWYALYDAEARSIRVTFYLRDDESGEVRTPLREFSLEAARQPVPA